MRDFLTFKILLDSLMIEIQSKGAGTMVDDDTGNVTCRECGFSAHRFKFSCAMFSMEHDIACPVCGSTDITHTYSDKTFQVEEVEIEKSP